MANLRAIDETAFIKLIHHHVNTATPSGIKIKNAFAPLGSMFDSTVESGATRSAHHDLQLRFSDPPMLKNVEFKGSKHFKAIDETKKPWSNGVQFYNGPGSKFTIGQTYARQFYDTALDNIIAHYDIQTPKPSFEIWVKDAFRQGKPKTPFVCEIREKGYLKKFLSDCRKQFNKTFIATDLDMITLLNEVQHISNEVLDCKDYWLQIHGDIETPESFHVKWTNKISMLQITEVKQIFSKSNCDINFEFKCVDDTKFTAKMRWGYGQCITNIRIDIK